MKKFILITLISLCSCNLKDNTQVDITVERFDVLFSSSSKYDIEDLKNKYNFLFPKNYDNSVWINRLNDPIQKEITAQVDSVFSDFNEYEKNIENVFDNYIQFFPDYKIPRVITLISDVDYRNSVILTDSLLLIGLDNYLGTNHKFYNSIPGFVKTRLTPDYIKNDIANELSIYTVPKDEYYTFIDKIIYHGKIYYLRELILKNFNDSSRLSKKYIWANNNESFIWAYFIENELLFSSDKNLDTRFIDNGPFSKFYLSIDNESPAMIGKFIGYKIINSYMKNNNTELQIMLNMKTMDIYSNSKYKPKK